MIKKIISGGQTGADQGALRGAELAGVPTGGAAPKYFTTEAGSKPKLLKHYNLVESQIPGYAGRTRENVINSDGTLIFGDPSSAGSALTARICCELKKPCLSILWSRSFPSLDPYHGRIARWAESNNIETLNVAGNRESKNPGISVATELFIIGLIEELRENLNQE